MRRPPGFTLIELLIVVAIIAILAAIAVPNFLEAQTRAKVARVKSDLRTLTLGLEAYVTDWSRYPDIQRGPPAFDPPAFPVKASPDYSIRTMPRVSTPIAYLSQSFLPDPFGDRAGNGVYLGYANFQASEVFPELATIGITSPSPEEFGAYRSHGYLLLSLGPDRMDYSINSGADPEQGAEKAYRYLVARQNGVGLNYVYDPTNGTISVGDITRTAKGELR
jgi:prepilin-type N-terminal cleavage/methylation domain-containing protein